MLVKKKKDKSGLMKKEKKICNGSDETLLNMIHRGPDQTGPFSDQVRKLRTYHPDYHVLED